MFRKKTDPVRVDEETHKRLRLLAAHFDTAQGCVISVALDLLERKMEKEGIEKTYKSLFLKD